MIIVSKLIRLLLSYHSLAFIFFFFFLCISFSIKAQNRPQNQLALKNKLMSNSSNSYFWNTYIELGMQHFENQISDESLGSFLGIRLDFETTSLNWFTLHISPFLSARSGYIQSDLYDPKNNTAHLSLQQGYVTLHPLSHLDFSFGIISMRRFVSPLIAQTMGQTGIGITYKTNPPDQSHVEFTQNYFVPNSFQQNFNFQDRRPHPEISISSIKANVTNANWMINARASLLQAQHLPESLAEEANLKGNSIIFAINGRRTSFIHQFKILESHIGMSFYYKSYKLDLRATGIQNAEAPNQLNRGYLIEPTITKLWKNNNSTGLSYQFFYLEPDATISSLNFPLYESNRVGQKIEVSYQPLENTKLSFFLAERKPIYLQPFQQYEIISMFRWEMNYEIQ